MSTQRKPWAVVQHNPAKPEAGVYEWSAWDTQEQAQAEADRLNARKTEKSSTRFKVTPTSEVK